MIPKVIHYCWFGKQEKSPFILSCIQSWKHFLPDYEVIEWNEANFDVSAIFFTREAYNRKKWAFVTDYVRAYVLVHQGGIYLDTDVEIRNSLDRFLHHGAFSGFESLGYPFTAVWGSVKGHKWPEEILRYYHNLEKFNYETNTKIVSDFLISKYHVEPFKNSIQNLDDDICIYPSHFFCLSVEENYAIHHFNGSWTFGKWSIGLNQKLVRNFYQEKFLATHNKEERIKLLFAEKFQKKDLWIMFKIVMNRFFGRSNS